MPLPQATEDFYTTMQRYQLAMLGAGRRLWSKMLTGDFDGSWARIAPQLVTFTAGGQLAAARAGSQYVSQALDEQGTPVAAEATVRPQAFSGVASDGRSLPGLLDGAVVRAKDATKSRAVIDSDGLRTVVRGLDGGDALKLGQKWLEQALQSAIMDAARDAIAAEIIVRPQVRWIRVVNPPCCSRCAVLSADVYYWHQPMKRHPNCDCFALPTTVENPERKITSPAELVRTGQVTDLTKAQRARLNDGADLVKVLNESRDRWRERLAADRRAEKARSDGRVTEGSNPPPVGTTVHDLMARLTDRVQAVDAMRSAGIAT